MRQMVMMWVDNENPYYLGRNGEGQMQGVQVSNYDNDFSMLHIEPINSKGQVARCVMTVPLDKVDELVAALLSLRGLRIGDKVKLKHKVKGSYKNKEVGWIAAGTTGTLEERMDDERAQWVFKVGTLTTYVSADEVERV